jgi:hypothetical protein
MIAHSHHHGHKDKASHGHPTELWRGAHKDWRVWVVIIVMLAAIGTYVFTLDDSIQAGGPAPQAVSATTAPASPAK